jgi:membrane peptidoglycan carboxypeptidase
VPGELTIPTGESEQRLTPADCDFLITLDERRSLALLPKRMPFLARGARALVRRKWLLVDQQLTATVRAVSDGFRISPVLVAFLALAEDRRLGTHSGFDVVAIARALWRAITSRRREGASTIAQQLVRVLTDRRERTLRRKIDEILLSIVLTSCLSPLMIGRCYLYLAYFGSRMNGLRAAAQKLGIDPASPTDRQAAGLVARLKYPEPRAPNRARMALIQGRASYLIALSQKNAWSPSATLLRKVSGA